MERDGAAPVITRLAGGLGNQLFQYAAGKSLAEHLGAPLLLDRSHLDHPPDPGATPRSYALDAFRIPDAIATAELIADLEASRGSSGLSRRWRRMTGSDRVWHERSKHFDTGFFTLRAPVLLVGYWQCARYFEAIARPLREQWLVPAEAPDDRNRQIAAAIATCSAPASLHVRLGDYLHDARTAAYHGLLPQEYYVAAAELAVERAGVDHFFVFSDEPERATQRLRLPRPMTVVHHNSGTQAHWDLWLMRQCRHHIIANSSFSWWGAWLNSTPDNLVVAPRHWFADPGITHDLLPPTWTAL